MLTKQEHLNQGLTKEINKAVRKNILDSKGLSKADKIMAPDWNLIEILYTDVSSSIYKAEYVNAQSRWWSMNSFYV